MLYSLKASHLLLHLSIYIISLIIYVSFLQIDFKILREGDLPYAFFCSFRALYIDYL